TAISKMMIFLNAVQEAPAVRTDTMGKFTQLLAPFAPHIAEELWSRLGGKPSVLDAPWPAFDPARLVSDSVRIVFQINGKHRGDQLVPVGLDQDAAVALARAHPKVAPYFDGKLISRVIYVPGKILNVVLSDR